ncbi:MAG TPA: tripartite tricarboxylate transporter TctB family protein [Candidatus Caccocola faecipullorum]|nr:tripartite tricarboxylate transporter TctB family protein [Candidatus Caccocola faecipullorum]
MYINKEKVYSLSVTVISVLLTVQAFRYPAESSHFPRFLCILMVLFSLISLSKALKDKEQKREEITFASTVKLPLIVFLTAIAYIFGIAYVGYFVSTTVYMLVMMFLFGERRIIPMGAAVAVFLIVIYALFVHFLGLRLPEGILF